MASASATTTVYCCSRRALRPSSPSPTPHSVYPPATRHRGCIPAPSIGISSTTSSPGSVNRQDVRVTKAMCGADCWTDHRLIVSTLKLRILPMRRPQGQKIPKRLNVSS
ncbi:hypothetical protein RRG08_023743 [Elysia crispata]|uniref:Uncharacterized protein n=1 Tax=Elysia crispata TaxID=231223 RepID=A0AAE0ZVL8_9GAST|nr:hypothetical protein RRG08_023743 [Elysia crispata]